MGMKGWDQGQLCLCYELICKISLLPPAYVPAVGQRYPGCAPQAAVSRGFCAWVSSKGEVKKSEIKTMVLSLGVRTQIIYWYSSKNAN